MENTFFFSLLSIILGVLSLSLAVLNIIRPRHFGVLSLLSMLLASSAVVVQVFSLRFSVLVREDLDAVIDTINVLAWICLLLVGIVFLLNLISLIKNRNKPGQKKIT